VTTTDPRDTAAAPARLERRIVLTLAAGAGIAAANLYYAQPVLHTIAERFGASVGSAGLIVTASQIGYAVGLALLVPAGDLLNRKRLVPLLLAAAAVLLGVAAVAPSLGVLIGAMTLVGLSVVAAQILVPLAAELASDGERGKVVGTVMTGLLLGILLARTVSGVVAGLAGWRAVFVVAAVLAIVLRTQLPDELPRAALRYPAVMRSMLDIARTQPELRRSALLGSLSFGTFSVFWTTVAFHLSEQPFDYGDSAIGLLGLVGAAGALCATVAGRLADRGHAAIGRVGAATLISASFGLLWIGRTSIVVIVVGVLVLDIGVQGVQVLNQSTVYELIPGARSRINGVYMTVYFVGGALGSAAGAYAFDHGGWRNVCVLGGVLGAIAVGVASLPVRRLNERSASVIG
jgi:predicted MFS family arabinose efflux permease